MLSGNFTGQHTVRHARLFTHLIPINKRFLAQQLRSGTDPFSEDVTRDNLVKTLTLSAFALAAMILGAGSAAAGVIYDVNRSWANGGSTATLVGTVDVAIGSYSIQDAGSHPFNAVNLTLTVDGTSVGVNNVLTNFIIGTGVFTIQATATQLLFSASGDGTNPADLVFAETDLFGNRYAIGSDGSPAFEIGVIETGPDAGAVFAVPAPVYPVVWATVSRIPEPSALALFGLGLAGLGVMVRRRKPS